MRELSPIEYAILYELAGQADARWRAMALSLWGPVPFRLPHAQLVRRLAYGGRKGRSASLRLAGRR